MRFYRFIAVRHAVRRQHLRTHRHAVYRLQKKKILRTSSRLGWHYLVTIPDYSWCAFHTSYTRRGYGGTLRFELDRDVVTVITVTLRGRTLQDASCGAVRRHVAMFCFVGFFFPTQSDRGDVFWRERNADEFQTVSCDAFITMFITSISRRGQKYDSSLNSNVLKTINSSKRKY